MNSIFASGNLFIKTSFMVVKDISFIPLFVLTLLASLLIACSSRPEDATQVNEQPKIYPDYVDVTIPVDIAPLNFCMTDEQVETMDVSVKGSNGGELHVNGDYADFDIDEWHQIVEKNKGGQLFFTVYAEKEGKWTQYKDFTVNVSDKPLEAWGITYRRIPPSYELYSLMGLYQRDLSTFNETALLVNSQSPGMCINCHTANRTDPKDHLFHVRGEHGATVIHRVGKDELLMAKNDTLGGSMVYPYWHPGGRYCAFSTNKTSQMFHTSGPKRIEVYDSSSDVFIYDTQTHTILSDTLIMKKYWAENCPAFSPDGKWLYFITALRQVYPTDFDKECYSLCRVSFDEATGRIGEQVDTLIKANEIGASVSWPRPSYDGRFVMYTQANYGYFTVWHPEADLWLLDVTTGETRPMKEVNSDKAESLHNWSIDSHWFLFTSRRDDGLYTRVYLASIDEKGKATKPFMLPQRNPKRHDRLSFYSYNTPDFTLHPVERDARNTGVLIEQDTRTKTIVKTMGQN